MGRFKGFTLIELLIVVTIIAVIVAIAIPAYSKFNSKGRDTKRQSDMKVLQSSLEQYHADSGFYPLTTDLDLAASIEVDPSKGICSPNCTSPTKTYLSKLPQDPLVSNSGYIHYGYQGMPNGCTNSSGNLCTSYCLYWNMEDPTLIAIPIDSRCPATAVNISNTPVNATLGSP